MKSVDQLCEPKRYLQNGNYSSFDCSALLFSLSFHFLLGRYHLQHLLFIGFACGGA